MGRTTAEQTVEYIQSHADIRSCLKKGLLNYAALARRITQELGMERRTTQEAISIAALRYRETLKKEISYEREIKKILAESEIEVRNKMEIFILPREVIFSDLENIQQQVKRKQGVFYLLEGANSCTVITQEKFSALIVKKYAHRILRRHQNIALVHFQSPEEIEHTPGIIYYLTAVFFEHGVNIIELFSFWTDTIFAIRKDDVGKAMEFLQF